MSECPLVETPCGKVRGRVCLKPKVKDAKQVYNYAGIPFAKPPLGELRFEAPQKCEPWQGVLEATALPPAPMQDKDLMGSLPDYFFFMNQFDDEFEKFDEDCLYVNVFTSNPDKAANMPVMVWFHGGALQGGGMPGYDGQVLCGLHDVVLVVPNYRVNAFGFLSAGKDSVIPGNMGMKDQVLALEWVRDNIRNFGGNPDNVTIFGQSAGAACVSFHMLSPMSRGLFHRAIQHSGSATMPMYGSEKIAENLKDFLEAMGIEDSDPAIYIPKLKALPASKIIEGNKALAAKMTGFILVVDGQFLMDETSKLSKSGFAPVPCIIGCTSTEGSGIFAAGQPNFATGLSEEEWTNSAKLFVPSIVQNKEKHDEAIATIKSVYDKEYSADDKYKWSKMAASLMADSFFVTPTVEQALVHSDAGHPTYVYYMTQQLRCHHDDEYAVELKKKPEFCECDHGDDIIFTFAFPMINGKMTKNAKFTEQEMDMCLQWMTYVTNFATTGDPNGGKVVDYQWPRFDSKEQRYLTAQIPFNEDQKLLPNRYKLWRETMPALDC